MELTGARYADRPTVQVQTRISAPPDQVWPLVCDPLLMATFSDEVQTVEWVDGSGPATVGTRFRGHNKHRSIGEWTTTSTVIECEPPRVFAWAVEDPAEPTATWRFILEPDGDATVLTQWVQMGPARSGLSLAIDAMPDKEQKIVFGRLREFELGMQANLAAIKQRVESTA
ncbi:SRPBCC family protein [uncultured Jatrophihabitans sp.]|uniref:SRPBCC family protein n=1 Tax=uncultured Jatrophihabitans sp. TaxID=1610747 RepID=UPI0035CA0EBF